jgi:predicted GH43/DUF377 family glycosyl hydrolase
MSVSRLQTQTLLLTNTFSGKILLRCIVWYKQLESARRCAKSPMTRVRFSASAQVWYLVLPLFWIRSSSQLLYCIDPRICYADQGDHLSFVAIIISANRTHLHNLFVRSQLFPFNLCKASLNYHASEMSETPLCNGVISASCLLLGRKEPKFDFICSMSQSYCHRNQQLYLGLFPSSGRSQTKSLSKEQPVKSTALRLDDTAISCSPVR